MKKSVVVAVMSFALALTAVPAYANYLCQGTMNFVSTGNSGDVVVNVPGQSTQVVLCNLSSSTSNGFTADSCKNAYATLLSAKLSGQTAILFFSDSLSCSTQPSWSGYVSVYWYGLE
jgi:hypothetical protein